MISKCSMCFGILNYKNKMLICIQEDHKFAFTDSQIQIVTRKIDINWYFSDKTIECYVATTSFTGEKFNGGGKLYQLPWFEPNLLNIQLSIDKLQKLIVFL